jgi:hypothetical protein
MVNEAWRTDVWYVGLGYRWIGTGTGPWIGGGNGRLELVVGRREGVMHVRLVCHMQSVYI